jgi:hypothetical protein
MKAKIKISKELSEILEEANSEVERWAPWQRSLDPHGAELLRAGESEDDSPDTEESAA